MATSFLKSFMEVVNPTAGKAAQKARDPQGCKTEMRMHPEAAPNALLEMTSKEALEERSSQSEIVVVPQVMQEPQVGDEDILDVSGEEVPPEELPEWIIVCQRIPVDPEETGSIDPGPVLTTINETGSNTGDIVEDAKFFQEVATEYQLAYQSLDEKYAHQAVLVQEASEALKASESHVAELQQEVNALKQTCDTDIQQAVGQAVSQYEQHSLQSSPMLSSSSQRLLSCRDKCRCSMCLYQARGNYLQWVQLKKARTSGAKFSTTSQAL